VKWYWKNQKVVESLLIWKGQISLAKAVAQNGGRGGVGQKGV